MTVAETEPRMQVENNIKKVHTCKMASRKRQKYGSKTENLLVIKLDENARLLNKKRKKVAHTRLPSVGFRS